jgi:transcriptional regulator with XRE-family HTH domain
MEDIQSAGEFVSARRQVLGYSQEKLAEVAGCAPETLRKIEASGRRSVGGATQERSAELPSSSPETFRKIKDRVRRPGPALAKQLAIALELSPELYAPFIAWVRGATLPEWQLERLLATLPTSDIHLDTPTAPAPPGANASTAEASAIPLSRQAQRARQQMLAKVRQIWVTELLDQELTERTRIALRLVERSDLVHAPLRGQFQELERTARELDPTAPIVELFDAKNGELLVLGDPGAGKTMLLLELARALLARAAGNPQLPIPVVFNLSSWAPSRGALIDWVVDELNSAYDVPQRIAEEWLEADQVLPLLDGLDEVRAEYRAACAEAINAFRGEHGLVHLAVCSRLADYLTLGGVRLKLGGAVQIQPLDAQQIDAYLKRTGRADLRAALQQDPGLRELAHAPLMLMLLSKVFDNDGRGLGVGATSVVARRQQIFERYVEYMFVRRSAPKRYPLARMTLYLSWLARSLPRHSGTLFFIEQLHAGWIATPDRRKHYVVVEKLVFGFIVGMLSGVLWSLGGGLKGHSIALPATDYLLGLSPRYTANQVHFWLAQAFGISLLLGISTALAVWLAAGLAERPSISRYFPVPLQDRQRRVAAAIGCAAGLIDGLLVGIWNGVAPNGAAHPWLVGLGIGLLTALGAGLGAGFVYGRASHTERIVVVETFQWSWPDVRRWGAIGLAVGALLGLLYGLVVGAVDGQLSQLGYGLVVGLCNGFAGGLIAGMLVGIGRGEMPQRAAPNQGIRRSAKTALWVGGLTWLAMGLTAAASDTIALRMFVWAESDRSVTRWWFAIVWGLIHWPIWALSFGVGAGLLYGGLACLQHAIVRWMLWRDGAIPWRYARLLDAAAERILLRKIGGGYQFIHELLRDYFADLEHPR